MSRSTKVSSSDTIASLLEKIRVLHGLGADVSINLDAFSFSTKKTRLITAPNLNASKTKPTALATVAALKLIDARASFEQLDLSQGILRAVYSLGYRNPSTVLSRIMDPLKTGKELKHKRI